jgi:hypothetical protein
MRWRQDLVQAADQGQLADILHAVLRLAALDDTHFNQAGDLASFQKLQGDVRQLGGPGARVVWFSLRKVWHSYLRYLTWIAFFATAG